MATHDIGLLEDAIRKHDLAHVSELLQQSKDWADLSDAHGVSAVLLAKYAGADDIAQLLAEARGPRLTLFEAAAIGDLLTVLQSLARNPIQVRETSADGYTALYLAALYGHPTLIEMLLEQGADVNQVSQNREAVWPLHGAVKHSDATIAVSIARMLIAKGADVNGRDGQGFTPLHLAAQSGNVQLAKLLLAGGADRSLKSASGETPSSLATSRGHDLMSALL